VFINATWVISKVLHTVCFLFKNEFTLQNTFTGLQCNLHCALSQCRTFEQVLYSCLDAIVFDASDYSSHLIRHLLNASEAFPTKLFIQFWEQVKVWWAQPTRLRLVPKIEETTSWERLQKH
jgi:hypothetical protein